MLVRLTLVMGREPTPAARAVFQRVDRGKVLAGVSGDGLAVAGRAVVPQLGRVANRAARPLDVDVAAHLTRRGKEALARQGSSFGRIAGRRCHPAVVRKPDQARAVYLRWTPTTLRRRSPRELPPTSPTAQVPLYPLHGGCRSRGDFAVTANLAPPAASARSAPVPPGSRAREYRRRRGSPSRDETSKTERDREIGRPLPAPSLFG